MRNLPPRAAFLLGGIRHEEKLEGRIKRLVLEITRGTVFVFVRRQRHWCRYRPKNLQSTVAITPVVTPITILAT